MTKYSELAELAVRSSELFYQEKRKCEHCALVFLVALRKFLQAPDNKIDFVRLDHNLKATEETHPKFAMLTFAPDKRWYFGAKIHFSSPDSNAFQKVVLKISLRLENNEFVLNHERNFKVDPKSEDSFSDVLNFIEASLTEDLKSPGGSESKQRIGFMA